MGGKRERGAVLQFEFDRARVKAMTRQTQTGLSTTKGPYYLALEIMRGALHDVIENGGTLVIVASEKTITAVQRPDAEDLEGHPSDPSKGAM
jgi:hypothetical protein